MAKSQITSPSMEFTTMAKGSSLPNILFCFIVLLSWGVQVLSSMDPQEDSETLKLYEEWMSKNGRVHYGFGEKWRRFNIFKDNVKRIIAHNKVEGRKYDLAINKFADLTRQEFKARYTGFKMPSGTGLAQNDSSTYSGRQAREFKNLPSSVDWRQKGAVGSIRDQGQCGSCWAFSVVASVEGITHIKTGKLLDLSEKELIDCDPKEDGCRGGLMHTAFKWVTNNQGLNTEKAYPYKPAKGECIKAACSISAANISGYKFVSKNDEKALQQAVSKQPVSVAVDSSAMGFVYYGGGVFTGKCGTNLDHAVTIVGYDTLEDGTPYWILRNSWGLNWGEGGYMRMLRNIGAKEGLCGVAMYATYPVA